MQHRINTKRAVNTYLSECTTLSQMLPEEIVYEVGGPEKEGFLSGLLKTVDLPDVTIKPHRDMILLGVGIAGILGASIVAATYISKTY